LILIEFLIHILIAMYSGQGRGGVPVENRAPTANAARRAPFDFDFDSYFDFDSHFD